MLNDEHLESFRRMDIEKHVLNKLDTRDAINKLDNLSNLLRRLVIY